MIKIFYRKAEVTGSTKRQERRFGHASMPTGREPCMARVTPVWCAIFTFLKDCRYKPFETFVCVLKTACVE
jgi:hypothetical protein